MHIILVSLLLLSCTALSGIFDNTLLSKTSYNYNPTSTENDHAHLPAIANAHAPIYIFEDKESHNY